MAAIKPNNTFFAARGKFLVGGSVIFGQPSTVPSEGNHDTLKPVYLDSALENVAQNPQPLDSDAKFQQATTGILYGTGIYSVIWFDSNGVEVFRDLNFDISNPDGFIEEAPTTGLYGRENESWQLIDVDDYQRNFNTIDTSFGGNSHTLSNSDFAGNMPPYFSVSSLGNGQNYTITVPNTDIVTGMQNVSEIYIRKNEPTTGTITVLGGESVRFYGESISSSIVLSDQATYVLRRCQTDNNLGNIDNIWSVSIEPTSLSLGSSSGFIGYDYNFATQQLDLADGFNSGDLGPFNSPTRTAAGVYSFSYSTPPSSSSRYNIIATTNSSARAIDVTHNSNGVIIRFFRIDGTDGGTLTDSNFRIQWVDSEA